MNELWDAVFHINTLTAAVRLAAPIALAAMGAVISERAGVINLALEGKMLAGAFCAVYATYLTGSPWVGLLAALAAGAVLGGLLGLLAIRFRANQVVVGIGINILMLGLTTWMLQVIWHIRGSSPGVTPLPRWSVPVLHELPLLSAFTQSHSPLVYLALLAPPALWIGLYRSPWGLRVRMIGEHPEAALTLGMNVARIQYACTAVAGMLAALGGAQLSLGHVSWFSNDMTAGRGYMALAANILGQWNPVGAAAAAILFALTDAVQLRIQTLQVALPSELVQMLPYLLTLLVVAGVGRRSRPPSALGRLAQPGGED